MKPFAIVAISFFAVAALAQTDKVTITPGAKVGDVQKQKFHMAISVEGTDITLDANIATTVKAVDADAIKMETAWSDLKAEAGGSAPDITASPLKVTSKPTGELTGIAGGIDGSNPGETLLATWFIPPTKEVAAGDTYKASVAAVKDVLPAYTYVGTYVGKTTLNGKDVYQFKATISTASKDTISAEATFWVLQNGTIVKAESKFKNLDVPRIGQSVDGKITVEPVA